MTVVRGFAFLALAALTLLSARSQQTMSPPLWLFFGVMLAVTVAQVLAWRSGESLTLREVALWAIAFRVPAWFGQPLYEDDFYRYLWDGRESALTGNPYGKAPADFEEDADRPLAAPFPEILAKVNFPEIPTIYGPVCQATFAAAYWISPGRLPPLKLIYAIFDLGLALVLYRLGVGAGGLAVYLWSPLVLKEIGFTAHTDILVAFFAAACLLAMRRRWFLAAGVLCALALGSKVTAALLIPLFLVEIRAWRGALRFLVGLVGATGAIYGPFLQSASESDGLRAFLDAWEFNSFVFGVLKEWTSFGTARTVCLLATLGGVLALMWRAWQKHGVPAYELALAWFFLLSPVVNPWYLVLWLPFVALKPTGWSVAACAAVLLSYATGNNVPGSGVEGFNHPWWVRPLELFPVVVLLLLAKRGTGTVSSRAEFESRR